MAETLTIVLKADGSGLTGTLAASTGEFRKFGVEVDNAGKKAEDAGKKAEAAGTAAKRGGDSAAAATKKWEQLGGNIGTVLGGMITGLTALMVKQINVADNTGKMAERLGVGSRFISEMGYAAKESGADTRVLEGALSALNVNATKTADGVKGPVQAFRAIGVSATDTAGKVKSLETLLPQISDRFAKMEDGPRKSAAAIALFGEQGRQLLPFLNQGSAGIEDLRSKAVELGLSLGDDVTQQAAQFNDNLAALKDQSLGLVNHLVADALPALAAFSSNLAADGKAASEAGRSYSVLGTLINMLATAWYGLKASVSMATVFIAAAVDVVVTTVKGAAENVGVLVSGAASLVKSLATGDLSGAAATVSNTFGTMTKNAQSYLAGVKNSLQTAHEMALGFAGEAVSNTMRQWSDATEEVTASTKANTAATEHAGQVYATAAQSQRDKERADREAAQSMQALNDIIRAQQNEYVGPVAKAWNDYQAVLAKVKKEQEDLSRVARTTMATDELVAKARSEAASAYARNLLLAEREQQEIERRRDVVGSLVQDYIDESRAVALSAREHTVQQALLRAEDQARKNFNKGLRDSIDLSTQEVAALRAGIQAAQNQREFMQLAADAAQDYRNNWWNAIDGVSGAFGTWISRGISGFRDFTSELKDIGQRWIADMVATFAKAQLGKLFTGWMNGGSGGTGWMSQLAGLLSGSSNLTGTSTMAASSSWMGALGGAGSIMGFGNNTGSLAGIAGASATASGSAGIGDMVQIGGMLYKAIPAGGISGGMIAGASYAGGALGALYGWNKGGDTVGKGLGAAAYGAAGYYGATAVGTVAAGYAAAGTAGAAAAGSAALAAIPVAGWVALAAIVVDKISGGKLFGTKYQTKETGQTINIDEAGGSVSAYAYQEGQKSLFRGKKRRTIDIDASAESKEAANELYALIQQTAKSAADALGLASVDMISGSFKAVYDKKGNLTSELATVLGRTYSESFELFQQRLQAENIIAQVGQLDDTASEIANRWRNSAEKLLDGSQFLLAAAADFNSGAGLLTVGGLSRLTDLIEKLREGEETLTQAYQRVMQSAQSYASTAAGAYQDVATAGFSNFAKSLLQVKQEEKERIRALQDQAKALSGLSAREVDLAKVREAAQLKTDALVTSLQGELVDLALNRLNDQIAQLGGSADGAGSKISDFINSLRLSDTLSPETDVAKRGTAANLMESAALAGNVDSFIDYAQQMLEVSRRLNASGAGYQADYDRVMSMAKQFGGAGSLQDLYAQREALVAQQEAAARLERAQRIAQGVSDLAGVKGGDPFDILRTVTGMSAEALAGDLGLSVNELSKYLENQQTDIGDLADILLELPQRIASEMIILLANKEVPITTPAGTTTGTGSTSSASSGTPAGLASDAEVLQELRTLNARIERNSSLMENHLVLR